MTAIDQQTLSEEQLRALYRVLSPERMTTYLVAAGRDDSRAMRLYIWNARVGEAFHIPIQAVEVGLRNCVNHALVSQFGPDWWQDPRYLALIDFDRQNDLDLVMRRIRNRNLQRVTGQIVAGLSFGFWVGMLQARYNIEIWSRQLRVAFPHFPEGRARKSLAKVASDIATLRNRISHHEPLIKRSLLDDYKDVMMMLGWVCPTKLEWVRPHCRLPDLVRQKP